MTQMMNRTNRDRIVCIDDDKTKSNDDIGFVQFSFPCKLHVINLCTKTDHHMFDEAFDYYKRLILETTSQNMPRTILDEQIHFLDNYSLQSVSNLFRNLATKHYEPCISSLHCGSLMSPITIFPPLKSYSEFSENIDEIIIAKPSTSNGLVIYGFLELSEIASPPIHSRHIILPNVMNREQHFHNFHSILTTNNLTGSNCELNPSTLVDLEEASKNLIANTSTGDDINGSKQPSLCVLLHGSLRVRNSNQNLIIN